MIPDRRPAEFPDSGIRKRFKIFKTNNFKKITAAFT